MLSGEKLYVEFFETNPPFSVWLYMPPVALAKMLDMPPEILVHAWTYLAAIMGLGFAGAIVRRAQFPERAALFSLAPVFYSFLVIMPGNAFSQREHIGMALFLPLLALMAWRARGRAAASPTAGIAILAGLCGSVLLLVKPHYAVMVLAPALFVAYRQRSIRPIFALEHWTIGAVCLAYLATVFFVYYEFVSDVYPVLTETYLKVRFVRPIFLEYGLPYAMVMFLVWRLCPRHGVPELASVAVLASLAGIVPLLYQGKGFTYHAYPAFLCALVALCCLLALPKADRQGNAWPTGFPFLAKLVPIAALVAIAFVFTPFRPTWKPDAELVRAVRAVVDRPTVAQIGSDLAIGHPFSRMIGGRWSSAYSSDWLGTSAFILRETTPSEQDAKHYLSIAERYVAAKRSELERTRPDIVLTQNNDIFWQKIMAERDGLAPFLEGYRLIAEDKRRHILVRKDLAVLPHIAMDEAPSAQASSRLRIDAAANLRSGRHIPRRPGRRRRFDFGRHAVHHPIARPRRLRP